MASAALLDATDLRRAVRVTVVHRTVVTFAGLPPQGATLHNISRFGALITCLNPRPDGWMTLRLPFAGDLEAEIVWAMGERIGCQFAAPLDQVAYQIVVAGMDTV